MILNNQAYTKTSKFFIVPRFQSLVSELDLETLFHTPPETSGEWRQHFIFNSGHFRNKADPLPQWEKMTKHYPGIAPRVLILGCGSGEETNKTAYYSVRSHDIMTLVPYEGILSYFFERVKNALVKNGISKACVDSNFDPVPSRANWFLGYDENSGEITVIDCPKITKSNQFALNFLDGAKIPEPNFEISR